MSYLLQDVDLWLVDSLVVPVSLHGLDGRCVHANVAAERASGYSNAQLRGKHFTDLLRPEARENVEAQFRRTVEPGERGAFPGGAGATPAAPTRRLDRRRSHSRLRGECAVRVDPHPARSASNASPTRAP